MEKPELTNDKKTPYGTYSATRLMGPNTTQGYICMRGGLCGDHILSHTGATLEGGGHNPGNECCCENSTALKGTMETQNLTWNH
jgi:hypothetical protein